MPPRQVRVLASSEDSANECLLYAGVQDKPIVFLFNDTQVIESSFLEDVNGMLTSGEVSNLYGVDELGQVYEAMRPVARTLNNKICNKSYRFGVV